MLAHRKEIAELAVKHAGGQRWSRWSQFADAGGLMILWAELCRDRYMRAALYVDKILKGAKPRDLPVEQPRNSSWSINLKTAKQIGLTIPPNVLARADRVIK